MSRQPSIDTRALKVQDDKLVFKAHGDDQTNLSRNTKRVCGVCEMKKQAAGLPKSETLKLCSKCKRVWYCSRECQSQDWKRHKPFCQIHQASQAAMDQNAEALAAGLTTSRPGMPNAVVLRSMIEDFANLHTRMLATVVGHELGAHGGTFPPMDAKTEFVALSVKLRDPALSPASVFEFTGGEVRRRASTLAPGELESYAPYAEKLSQMSARYYASALNMFIIPVRYTVEETPMTYLTTLEIRRDQLNQDLLKKTVPDDAPWWAQLEYNAQKGLVVRRHWADRLRGYIELLGTLQEEDGAWRFAKAEDSRGNQTTAEVIRERKKLLRNQ